MKILQVNTADAGGGAEGSAYHLFRRYGELGHTSMLAVGTKYRQEAGIFEIPREPAGGLLRKSFFYLSEGARELEKRGVPGMRKVSRILARLGSAERFRQWHNGLEESAFPGSRRMLEMLPCIPDIVHIHNMHGWYFDWEMLPALSARIPVILNLRDAWAITGHCAYFMDCQRWKSGCGECPSLTAYPGLHCDGSAENWRRKADIYSRSRLYVTAPSQWLLDCAKSSMLQAAEYKVIPNGIDTSVFKPGDKAAARERLGLPQGVRLVMFATASKNNTFKDMETLHAVIEQLSCSNPELHFLCVGTALKSNVANLHSVGYVSSPEKMAQYYQAADLFLHTAKAEAFGKTVTEAMACGTPVVASAVGGLLEQIQPGVTGELAGCVDDFIAKTGTLLALSQAEYNAISKAASIRGSQFSLERQSHAFLDWYSALTGK